MNINKKLSDTPQRAKLDAVLERMLNTPPKTKTKNLIAGCKSLKTDLSAKKNQ